jgi:hypothetical protein
MRGLRKTCARSTAKSRARRAGWRGAIAWARDALLGGSFSPARGEQESHEISAAVTARRSSRLQIPSVR